jgi:aminopeptidase N
MPKLAVDKKAREGLEELLDDRDPLLRLDVARALGEMGDSKSRGPLRERLEADLDPRVRRRIRETLRDLAEPKRATEGLREELEKLQSEHAEVRLRLTKLEARLEVDRAPAEGAPGRPPTAKAAAGGAKNAKKAKKGKSKKGSRK